MKEITMNLSLDEARMVVKSLSITRDNELSKYQRTKGPMREQAREDHALVCDVLADLSDAIVEAMS